MTRAARGSRNDRPAPARFRSAFGRAKSSVARSRGPYLADCGIAPGDRFQVISRQPFGGPLFLRFGPPSRGTEEREQTIGGELARAMRIECEGGAT